MNSYTRPDALLEEANREKRGKLKIFLGAAPGVGKTYEMLQNAQNQKKQGMDVVVGLVETHGRRETESLISGLEIVPRQRLVYKGRLLEEMDLDAILKRAPQLVLVDEFAHTNAADSRHPKRYMDVEEILAAGINVYTTLNIQHLAVRNGAPALIGLRKRWRSKMTPPRSLLPKAIIREA
jgi:two-component system sensor histidine kinase KdpD